MRFARLFDAVGSSGEPFFAPDRARIADPVQRAQVTAFLRSGTVIRRVSALDVDRIDASRGRVVPMSSLTDGQWVWNAGLRYYVETYGIAPEDEFLEYMVERGYRAPVPDESACQTALEALRNRQRRSE